MSSVYGEPDAQRSAYQPGSPGYYYLPPGSPYPGPYGPGYQMPPPPPPPRRPRHRWLAAAAAIVLMFGVGAGVANWASGGTLTGLAGGQLSTASIVSMTDPAVVDIVSTLGESGQGAQAAGTGIVLTSDGEVLTNNHVIDGATSIQVTDVGNGQSYQASVVGYDATHDIALIKLAGASGLKTATIGDSGTVRVGQRIVALGNAGGKGGAPSVAEGQVTGLNQSITASDAGSGTSERLTGMIQTDADIQPGDSGGPALNTKGQVIGMDTAASSSQGQSASGTVQAFAIPINQAMATVRQIESGTATATVHIGPTAFLGVALSSQGGGFGSQDGGAPVAGVVPGTAAATAGLSQGDVITSVGGRAVSSANSLRDALTSHHPGDQVTITWTDGQGQQQSATVALGTGPAA